MFVPIHLAYRIRRAWRGPSYPLEPADSGAVARVGAAAAVAVNRGRAAAPGRRGRRAVGRPWSRAARVRAVRSLGTRPPHVGSANRTDRAWADPSQYRCVIGTAPIVPASMLVQTSELAADFATSSRPARRASPSNRSWPRPRSPTTCRRDEARARLGVRPAGAAKGSGVESRRAPRAFASAPLWRGAVERAGPVPVLIMTASPNSAS